MDRLVLLGTGTCRLMESRRASSVLLELGERRIVYDMGRGIADRLASLGLRQDDLCHVVISHFHPDHVSDLVPFLHAAAWSPSDPRSLDLHLYGPPGLAELVRGMQRIYGVAALGQSSWALHVHEQEGPALRIDGLDAEFVHLPPAGNRGLRLRHNGHCIALTGDSNFHADEVAFLRDVDLAIFDSGHLTDDEIVELAVRSNPRRLVCSHVYRELDVTALQARAVARGFTGRLFMGQDLEVWSLGPSVEPAAPIVVEMPVDTE